MTAQPVCPQLHLWRQIYSSLTEAREQAGGSAAVPMPPQVFNMQGWLLSTDEHKRSRWNATLAWRAEYEFSQVIPELSGHDWYEGKS